MAWRVVAAWLWLVPGMALGGTPLQSAEAAGFWVEPVTAEVTPTGAPGPEAAAELSLRALRAERESAFVVLKGAPAPGRLQRVEWTALRGEAGELPAQTVRVWRVGFRDLGGERVVADALLPKETGWKAGENVPLLVEVAVPRGAKAGSYQAVLRLEAQGRAPVEVPLRVEVLEGELPAAASLPSLFEVEDGRHWAGLLRPQGRSAAEGLDVARAGLENRLTVLSRSQPVPTYRFVPGEGGLQLDFADFDAQMGPLLEGVPELEGARVSALPLRVPAKLDAMGRFKYELAFRRHLRERGWEERLVQVEDGAPVPAADRRSEKGERPLPRVRPGDWMTCRLASATTTARVWWQLPSQGAASLGTDAHPVGVRALPWLAHRAGAAGLSAEPKAVRALLGVDESGRRPASPSVRLHVLRDGLEDYELLKQAERAGLHESVRRWTRELAQSPNAVVTDARRYDEAKSDLAKRIAERR